MKNALYYLNNLSTKEGKSKLTPPPKLTGTSWQKLELTEKEIKAKRDAIACYRSQIKYNPPYLFTFARKNELFGDLTVIKLNKPKTKEII